MRIFVFINACTKSILCKTFVQAFRNVRISRFLIMNIIRNTCVDFVIIQRLFTNAFVCKHACECIRSINVVFGFTRLFPAQAISAGWGRCFEIHLFDFAAARRQIVRSRANRFIVSAAARRQIVRSRSISPPRDVRPCVVERID